MSIVSSSLLQQFIGKSADKTLLALGSNGQGLNPQQIWQRQQENKKHKKRVGFFNKTLRPLMPLWIKVQRFNHEGHLDISSIVIEGLVAGDIVQLKAGDIVPAHLRLLESQRLFVEEGYLNNQWLAVPKFAESVDEQAFCYQASLVVNGSATGVILGGDNSDLLHSVAASLDNKMISLSAQKKLIISGIDGVLTQGKIFQFRYLDINGLPARDVLDYGWLNSFYHGGKKNLLDAYILNYVRQQEQDYVLKNYAEAYCDTDAASVINLKDWRVVADLPFDYQRRLRGVVVERPGDGAHIIICKGRVASLLACCDYEEEKAGIIKPCDPETREQRLLIAQKLENQGMKILAVAYKVMEQNKGNYDVNDEKGLILKGFLGFLDPPSDHAMTIVEDAVKNKWDIKILTTDSPEMACYFCRHMGIVVKNIWRGEQINNSPLLVDCKNTTIFADLYPIEQQYLLKILQKV